MDGFVDEVIAGLLGTVLDGLTSATLWALGWVLDVLSGTVFRSPDVTVLPQVRHVSGQAEVAANAVMVLAVTAAAVLAMVRGESERYQLKELLPRVVVAFAGANLGGPLVGFAIEAANALTAALTAQFGADASTDGLRRVIAGAGSDPRQLLLVLVLREVVLFLLLALLFTWLGRIAVLLVLAATGPLALACHAFLVTDPVAQLWWRSLGGVLLTQVLQAVTVHVAVAVLLAPGANLPALGLPDDPTGLLNLLIAVFVLWTAIRIPAWLSRHLGVGQSRAASTLGYVVRVIVVQQALRAAGIAIGGRRAATRAVGPRLPATHLHQHAAAIHMHEHTHNHTHLGGRRDNRYRREAGDDPRPDRQAPAGARARPHSGRGPQEIGEGAGRGGGGSGGAAQRPPARPVPPPPGAVPLRRPVWHAYGARPSGTGWPAPEAAARPPAAPRVGGRASGTGWPSTPRQVPRRTGGGNSGQ
ncbi:conjugal transfer protein TrbL family protein [Phytohabitans aurantiacus]|uniref:Uncharacterized protein n=1 Tax=Phytohabitans aurantiacus TaxID=3016789 RepID=A0ABQ5RBM1_9ACTN|nr:conjugal transfer protein TrbL family protein [Phytohabitans aurantiacus]GLI02991.1 hypothetical protein Pa4123_82690 [Phytohabitans aurantiacus]